MVPRQIAYPRSLYRAALKRVSRLGLDSFTQYGMLTQSYNLISSIPSKEPLTCSQLSESLDFHDAIRAYIQVTSFNRCLGDLDRTGKMRRVDNN